MIRPVAPEDAAAVCGIYNYYIENTAVTFEEEPVSVSVMESRINGVTAKYPWLIYEEAGEVLGYAYIHAWHERPAYRFTAEDSIYIKHGKTGRGAGKALLARLLEEARKQDVHVLMAVIAVPNEASTGLHEKFGFRQVGCFPGVGYKFGRRLDVGYWELMRDRPCN
ncbi:MAG: GNAT family N-acetyltransferase [Treponema sp.]|jgi:phosphinothricin acetyltransferase|nr:GNAT family N-acetyltransferase [Treponema sp.]